MRMAIAIGAAALLAACADDGQRMASGRNDHGARPHGPVLLSGQDTPDQIRLLPTAQAKAEMAAQHMHLMHEGEALA